jgi:hypothetical protein
MATDIIITTGTITVFTTTIMVIIAVIITTMVIIAVIIVEIVITGIKKQTEQYSLPLREGILFLMCRFSNGILSGYIFYGAHINIKWKIQNLT